MANKNPWGRRPADPDLDERMKNWQRRFESFLGPGGESGSLLLVVVLVAVGLWLATGFYVVDAAERGVILRFGRYVETTEQGLHWRWPWPIETRQIVDVARNESIEDKTRMLTSDENLVDITIAVQYLRADPTQFLFNVRKPEETLRDVSESAIREIVGQSTLDAILGAGRQAITERTKTLIQKTLNSYKTGIDIITVNLTSVNVPDPVAPSQKDAIKAREDRDRFGQEAQAYANDILPRSRGAAARQLQEAQAYRSRVTAQAEGETARFNQLLAAYERSPKVTRQRLYLETVESVLGRSRKVLLDTKPGNDNVLYLPLDKLLSGGSGAEIAPPSAPSAIGNASAEIESVTVDGRGRGER